MLENEKYWWGLPFDSTNQTHYQYQTERHVASSNRSPKNSLSIIRDINFAMPRKHKRAMGYKIFSLIDLHTDDVFALRKYASDIRFEQYHSYEYSYGYA